MPKQIRKPADPDDGPLAAFGFELRTLRQGTGLTYTAIAQKSYFSKSAMHAVDQGHHVPSATILKAFVTACGKDPRPWIERRAALLAELAASKDEAWEKISLRDRGLPAPAPATVATPGEFNDGLKRLREWSGMTYRQIEELSADTDERVAPSTLCGAFTRGTLPRRPLVAGFLKVIGLPETDQHDWLAAWQAIKDNQPVRAATPVLPTEGWLVQLPVGKALEIDQHTFRARMTPRGTGTDTQADWVIPTYLPSKDIPDWRYTEGYWRDVEPALTVRYTDVTARNQLRALLALDRTALLAAVFAGFAILAILLLVLAIVMVN